MAFKDHVGKHGKTLNKQLTSKYGDLLGLMSQALDTSNPGQQQAACKSLGQMNLESQLYNELSPQLKQAILNQIQATTQFNVDKAEILKAAGKGATQIEKAASGVALGNTEYLNKRSENALDFYSAKTLEKQRHNLEMSYLRLNSMIKQAMNHIDGQARFITASNQPELRQIQATQQHQKQAMNHLLSNGDQSRVDLMPAKDYTQVKTGVQGFLSSVAERLGLLL